MPANAPCPRCKKPGFVRVENVIKAGQAIRACFCGSCGHQWRVAEDGTVIGTPDADKPDRSR